MLASCDRCLLAAEWESVPPSILILVPLVLRMMISQNYLMYVSLLVSIAPSFSWVDSFSTRRARMFWANDALTPAWTRLCHLWSRSQLNTSSVRSHIGHSYRSWTFCFFCLRSGVCLLLWGWRVHYHFTCFVWTLRHEDLGMMKELHRNVVPEPSSSSWRNLKDENT